MTVSHHTAPCIHQVRVPEYKIPCPLLIVTLPMQQATAADRQLMPPGQHTRCDPSVMSTGGRRKEHLCRGWSSTSLLSPVVPLEAVILALQLPNSKALDKCWTKL